MRTKKLGLFIAGIIFLLASCQSGQETKVPNTEQSNFHKVVVQDMLQASEYTYLRVKDNNNSDVWLAVPTIKAKVGDTYYYEGGVEMKKFESKELNRVFESIILLEKINTEPKSSAVVASDNKSYSNPPTADQPSGDQGVGAGTTTPTSETYKRKATPPEKKEIKVAIAKGGISIADLYAKKEAYSGKTVIIKGQVTKYTPGVMNKNWIHIQDGSDFSGKFDLTVTSDKEVALGDIVTLEGKIALNKDLGYGYFFDVIMEDAITK